MDSSNSFALEVHDLRKSYKGLPALRGVSFTVPRGEIFTIVGPNGSGKTTIMEILEGIRRHDGGTFRVLGGRPSDLRVRESIGVQLQEAEVMQNLRPMEVLALFRSFYSRGLEPREALDRVSLDPPRRALVRELSGGQRKRLLVALAIVNDPDLVFLDEPTTGLDPAVRREVWGIIQDLRARGKTVVLTTHYLEEAERLSDRVAILYRGTIAALDSPAALVGASGLAGLIIFTFEAEPPGLTERIAATFPNAVVSGASARVASVRFEDDLHQIFEIARAAGTSVRELDVHAPTLEDVYLFRTGRAWPSEEPATEAR
ncbi:MAG: ABC transporter ATP-binding protein [Spirochaetia bacterium]|jgi:ABC-2 type transport system ATP-binding protein